MLCILHFVLGAIWFPQLTTFPFFIPVLHAGVLFIDFFPYPEACIFIADGRHLHHGHCNLLGCAAKSVAGASGGTLGYLGEAQPKKNGERKGETETETVKGKKWNWSNMCRTCWNFSGERFANNGSMNIKHLLKTLKFSWDFCHDRYANWQLHPSLSYLP